MHINVYIYMDIYNHIYIYILIHPKNFKKSLVFLSFSGGLEIVHWQLMD